MTEVPLTQGQVAIIDDEDVERVLAYQWSAWWNRNSRRWYARALVRGTGRIILLHRFIMNAPSNMQVDHINMDGLDNRRSNLRLATDSQNKCNRRRQRDNKSGFKGVCWSNVAKRFVAQIKLRGVNYHLGYFTTAEAAARIYDAAAMFLHGEFARFNFPEESELLRRVLARIQPTAA